MRRVLTARPWLPLLLAVLAPVASLPAQAPLMLKVYRSPDSTAFHVTSTLIAGPTEALLVDAQMRDADASQLADRIAASGRRLSAIFLTHADHDHLVGLVVLHQRFPETPIYMTAPALAEYRRNAPRIFATQRTHSPAWSADSVPPVAPLPSTRLAVDGQEVQILPDLQGDAYLASNSVVWVPSLKAVIAGDILFSGTHLWLGNSTSRTRTAWIKSIDQLARLRPAIVVPGHIADPTLESDPDAIGFTRDYLVNFDTMAAIATNAEQLATGVRTRYPALKLAMFTTFAARLAVPN